MRVLLLFPMADGQTGPAIKHAFERLGHKVVVVDAKTRPRLSYHTACEFKPDLIFCSRTQNLTEEIARIKRKLTEVLICMWNVDARKDINSWSHLFALVKLVDFHFVVDAKSVEDWKVLNPNTYWLPQGLQDEVYMEPKKITAEDRKRYTGDVSFCGDADGKYHKFRGAYLATVRRMGINFKYWGGSGNPRVLNEDHNKVVALSKISLGCSGYKDVGCCVSVRDYKILGAGGFLLTDCGGGLEEIFPCNAFDRVLDCYKSPEELEKKIRYWLAHPEERRQIARRGYTWVHKNARYVDRIKMALACMKEALC